MQNNIANPFSWYSNNITKVVFWTCLLTLIILFTERIFLIFSYESYLQGIDNNFDYPVIRSLAGFSMYPDPNDFPFAVNPYAPLYFITCKWIAAGLHINPVNTIAVYRISRSVAFVADTGTILIFFFLLRKFSKCNNITTTILTAFYYIILCYLGYTFNRSDCLFLFFYSCTLLFLFSQTVSNKILNSFLIALCATLTIFSKQNGIILLLLVPIWMIINKDYKRLIQCLFFLSVFLFSSYYYFQHIFTKNTFTQHIFHALKNRIDPHWFYVFVFKPIAESPVIIPLTIAAVVAIKTFSENRKSLLSSVGILFIIQLIFSTGLSFKWGSSVGYFNESYFLGFILIGFYYNQFAQKENTRFINAASTYIYPAFLIFVLHVTIQFYFYFLNGAQKNKTDYENQQEVSNYIKKQLNNKDNYVINLTSPNSDFFKNVLYKESAAPNFDAVSCCTLPDKIFDYRGLLNGLQNGKILYLIEKKDSKEESLWGVPLNKYKIDTTMFEYSIYKFDSAK